MLAAGERLDVISTHSKYAPSQRAWLRPLDGLVDVAALAAPAVELGRFDGRVALCPRNVDVRVLWAGRRCRGPPHLGGARGVDCGVRVPGPESGLFGTFFELVAGHGGALFDARLRPTMQTPECRLALDTLVALAARRRPP